MLVFLKKIISYIMKNISLPL